MKQMIVKKQNDSVRESNKTKNFDKIWKTLLLAASLLLLSAMPVFARGWCRGLSKNAWWYDLGNGNYYKSSWQWLDGNSDGIAECYRFDYNGWMAENTVTSDGYTVNQNGAWTVNNVVQTRAVSSENNNIKKELLGRINQYRIASGLKPLSECASLSSIADTRARECSVLFSHTRPQGGSVLTEADVCGEILASNQDSPVKAFQAWQKSPSHNRLMLRDDFVRFGAGYYADSRGNDYWVVLFSFYN